VGLLVLSLAEVTHANLFLAAFAAGITMATVALQLRDSFHQFGELVAELLKLAAILVFGALISPAFLGEVNLAGYVFAVLALVLARPIAIAVSFLGSRLPWQEQAAVAWFGPKVRLGRVRPARPGEWSGARRRDVPPHRAGRRAVDPGPLLERRAHRAVLRSSPYECDVTLSTDDPGGTPSMSLPAEP